jgi:DNA-binding XRE family transcriptional regulator
MKEISVKEHLQEKLKDPYFKELHELEQQKFAIVRKIIDYRIKHGLSQTDLARQIGVSQQHISKIEGGEFSSVATLERVLLGIGMTVRMEAVKLSHPLRAKKVLAAA